MPSSSQQNYIKEYTMLYNTCGTGGYGRLRCEFTRLENMDWVCAKHELRHIECYIKRRIILNDALNNDGADGDGVDDEQIDCDEDNVVGAA